MSALPEWIEKLKYQAHADPMTIEALAIAWEALESYDNIRINGIGAGGYARDAMRRISDLGRETV